MSGAHPPETPRGGVERARWYTVEPSWKVEVVVWFALAAVAFGIRAHLASALPFAIWSDDAGSYAASAARWLESGVWVSDGRRGPTYSLLIAACMKLFGTVDAVMIVQHVAGACAILLSVLVLRLLCGRAALIPIALAGYAYATYALPISLEHLVRNETILVCGSSVALAAWCFAVRGSAWWYLLSGTAGAITALTKSIFAPFPVLVLGTILLGRWRTPVAALTRCALFVAGLALPHLGVRWLDSKSPWLEPKQPQSGILLFGRTAQFTKLDGGIEPELKALIREDIEAYRKLGKLDNNVIVNRTAVPRLRAHFEKIGRTPKELDRVCRAFAVEAIRTRWFDYAKQVLSDCRQLHLTTAKNYKIPKFESVQSLKSLLTESADAGTELVNVPATLEKARAIDERTALKRYYRWTSTSWMFRLAPVLLTSLLLPLMIWNARGETRLWWLGCAGLWYFTIVLLCTVGRPMDRYVLPMAPVMFWTLGGTFVLVWRAVTVRLAPQSEIAPKISAAP